MYGIKVFMRLSNLTDFLNNFYKYRTIFILKKSSEFVNLSNTKPKKKLNNRSISKVTVPRLRHDHSYNLHMLQW